MPFVFSMSGETLDVGIDTGSPVGPYKAEFPCNGDTDRIEIDLHPELSPQHREQQADGQFRAAISSQ